MHQNIFTNEELIKMIINTTPNLIILEQNGERIYFSRDDGSIIIPENDLSIIEAEINICGDVEFLIGLLSIEKYTYLFFVTESSVVAHYRGTQENTKHEIRRIDKVVAIDTKMDCSQIKSQINPSTTKLKQNTEKFIKFFADKISKDSKPTVLDDVIRLFNDSKDFYFCRERNVTISAQTFFTKRSNLSEESFFWNKYMLQPLVDALKDKYSHFTCPIMQGFVSTSDLSITDQIEAVLSITIISRRSTHRAGARYLRRGIDEDANVANFVETELILNIFEHELSYIQIRGSIPVFWSQKGFKYRPPLIINKSIEETHSIFEKHFSNLKKHYGTPIVSVTLVDQKGREHGLAQRYLEHLIKLNDENVNVFSFDLHQHCRGLNFQKLQVLISEMEETLKKIGFCWVDKTGEVVQRQKGVVRTNCIDCLDRTNLVQGQLSLFIVLQQAQRLGIFGPLCEPPEQLIQVLQTIWADNGDVISTQYAGTAALKGDVTRSGERKITGIMKDGLNSASRYYLTHMRDANRQKAINLVTKQTENIVNSENDSDSDEKEEEENICRLLAETVQFLVAPQQTVIGGWGLINVCVNNDEIDTIVILTRSKLYIASYEIDGEKMNDVRIISLDDIINIQIGIYGSRQCLKLETPEDIFVWKPSQVRLFNNSAIRLKSLEEANEYILSVAEQINVGRNMLSGTVCSVKTDGKLSIPQMSVHRRSLAAMGSILTKIKKKTVSPMLPASSNSSQTKEDQSDSESTTSEVSQEPFFSLIPLIAQSQTKISLL
ncbi:unnamed protein product [Caenorhabditis angaria]|uniref:SAC domain-containing protein n=1 Tax=Caenorhabditis angaria TaxID=860376 RepID=A0A9P1MSU0_9PELO|nr:unnamed protein product [Caenorhabditis angaria]